MRSLSCQRSSKHAFTLSLVLTTVLCAGLASAAQLTLTWTDNSDNESGFRVERKFGPTGSFALLATVPVDTASYGDSAVGAGETYCYRVQAFNSAGASAYSDEVCGTIPAETFTLTVTTAGNGRGTVSSEPAGLMCGTDCAAPYASGAVVTLTASPAAGSAFSGWGGDADCTDGTVTMTTAKTCTATFIPQTFDLTVVKAGTGDGTVSSEPAGLMCGTDCAAPYASGAVVTLTANPAAGSTFSGWGGDADCTDGVVSLTAAKTCLATFTLEPTQTFVFSVTMLGGGRGTVSSTPAGLTCSDNLCSGSFPAGTVISLTATPEAGSTFGGWGGDADCADGTVLVTVAPSCTVTFAKPLAVQIGVFRPSTGRWYLDNGNGILDACTVDSCASFGGSGDLPVVGNWTGSGTNQLGVFDPRTHLWELDRNLNDVWEECVVDLCLGPFGKAKDLPVVGAWERGKKSTLLGVFRPGNGRWYLDSNGNGLLDDARIDRQWGPFGLPTHLPVAGDWTGTGVALPGTFDPATGQWQLDRNGNGIFDGCTTDICFGFGQAGDLPITEDWTGTGTAKAGVFSPATGAWRLDLNGNGAFDGCAVDACLGPFGQSGDRPVVGKW